MTARLKLLLAFVLVLAAVFGVTLLMKEGPREEPIVQQQAPKAKSRPLPAKLEMPADAPAEATRARDYNDRRWSHMQDTPQVVPGVDADGERYFMMKDAIVGRDGQGNEIYAIGMLRLQRFEGPTYKKKDRMTGSAFKLPGKFDPSAGGLASRVKSKRIPLDQLPDTRFAKPPPGITAQ